MSVFTREGEDMTHEEFLKQQIAERLSQLDLEIFEFRAQGRIALTYEDMKVRYGVGTNKARTKFAGGICDAMERRQKRRILKC